MSKEQKKEDKKKKEDKRSAKGKYQKWLLPENLTLIQGWRRDGLSDKQVADNMGIARGTLYVWLEKYKDLNDAYKKGSEVALYEVENALFKAACGYDVREGEQIEVTMADGTVSTQKRQKIRHIPPNVGAICFILKNRRPEKWRDKQVIQLDEKGSGKLTELIKGLKEDSDDIHTETETANETVADEQTETNKSS